MEVDLRRLKIYKPIRKRLLSNRRGGTSSSLFSRLNSKNFTLGSPNLIVSVDHKPLLGILNDRDLGSISNRRLRNLKEATFPWQFKIVYNPGKWHRGADAVSRNPVSKAILQVLGIKTNYSNVDIEDIASEDFEALTIAHLDIICNGMVTLSDLSSCAKNDGKYCKLIATISNGFPSTRQQLDPELREYWEVRSRLSVNKGIVFLDDRTVIPNKLRNQILDNLHSAHQGISSMRNRANDNIYWPGMSSSISNKRLTCKPCIENTTSQLAEPLQITPFQDWPFQKLCTDYFTINQYSYLVLADRYSGWISV